MQRLIFFAWAILVTAAAIMPPALAQLAPESTSNIQSLPATYPDRWIFIHDSNFPALIAGKVVIVDPGAENRHYKGLLSAAQFANFRQSATRPELYVAETFFARGVDGERTDVISIYDRPSLKKTGEILLPGAKRGQFVTQPAAFALSTDDRFGFVYNFTPAASVTVVDMPARAVLNEIQIPGCSMVYPTAGQGFASLCGNGTMVSFELDRDGGVTSRTVSDVFNDIDDDPMFMKAAVVDGIAYFPTFMGNVRPVDLNGTVADIRPAWSLVSEPERAANWRPGGWQLISTDDAGRLFVLMHKGGHDGSHDEGGDQVWVFDPVQQTRIARIELESWGITIEASGRDPSYLVVSNINGELDVYDSESGGLIRTIGGGLAASPFAAYAAGRPR